MRDAIISCPYQVPLAVVEGQSKLVGSEIPAVPMGSPQEVPTLLGPQEVFGSSGNILGALGYVLCWLPVASFQCSP